MVVPNFERPNIEDNGRVRLNYEPASDNLWAEDTVVLEINDGNHAVAFLQRDDVRKLHDWLHCLLEVM